MTDLTSTDVAAAVCLTLAENVIYLEAVAISDASPVILETLLENFRKESGCHLPVRLSLGTYSWYDKIHSDYRTICY